MWFLVYSLEGEIPNAAFAATTIQPVEPSAEWRNGKREDRGEKALFNWEMNARIGGDDGGDETSSEGRHYDAEVSVEALKEEHWIGQQSKLIVSSRSYCGT